MERKKPKDFFILTSELKESDVPDENLYDEEGLSFINSFWKEGGYSHDKDSEFVKRLHSFQEKVDNNKFDDLTIKEIRSFLFFYLRRVTHSDGTCDVKFYKKLFKLIKKKIRERK